MTYKDLEFYTGFGGVQKAVFSIKENEATVLYCDDGTYTAYILIDRSTVECGSLQRDYKGNMVEADLNEWLAMVVKKYGVCEE